MFTSIFSCNLSASGTSLDPIKTPPLDLAGSFIPPEPLSQAPLLDTQLCPCFKAFKAFLKCPARA